MKLGITLAAAGFAGTLLFLAGAADIGTWDFYSSNPWVLGAGGACFIVFMIGMYLVRKELNKKREAERRRLKPPPGA